MAIKSLLNHLKAPLKTALSVRYVTQKLPILIYHRVLAQADPLRPREIDRHIFDWQMALLARHFCVLPLHQALEKLQRRQLPARAICITFDDGYADNYVYALPILEKYRLPATFFIASGYLDGGRMWNDSIIETLRHIQSPVLDLQATQLGQFDISTPAKKYAASVQLIKKVKQVEPHRRTEYVQFIESQAQHSLPNDLMLTTWQLQQLFHRGMEIGGHTVSHPMLAKLDETTVYQEIFDDKIALEQKIQAPVRYFAFPYGRPHQDYLTEHVQLVRRAGYRAALSTTVALANPDSDLWQLPRFTPWERTTFGFMQRMLKQYLKT